MTGDHHQKNGSSEQKIKQSESYSIVREFWDFLKHSKKWWLLPIVVIIILMSVFVVLSTGSPVFPMIYAMF